MSCIPISILNGDIYTISQLFVILTPKRLKVKPLFNHVICIIYIQNVKIVIVFQCYAETLHFTAQ